MAALTDADAPGRRTQFYSMLGQRSIYHDGWLAATLHPPLSGRGQFEHDEWELFHLAEDRSQIHNLAAEEPERLQSLKDLWFYYAGVYQALPLDDRSAIEQVLAERPHGAPPRTRYTYYPHCSDVPEEAGASVRGRSAYTIAAGVTVDSADAEGVLYAHGGVAGGHSLYVKDRHVHYTFNWVGTFLQEITADRPLTPGPHVITAEFAATGRSERADMPGAKGLLTLYIDDDEVGSGEIVTQPGAFCLVGDGICVGRDSASPVTPDYADRGTFPFTGGTIDKVVVDVSGDRYIDHGSEVRAWFSID